MAHQIKADENTVTMSDLRQQSSQIFDVLRSGEKEAYYVTRDGEPAAVIVSVETFEMMRDQIKRLTARQLEIDAEKDTMRMEEALSPERVEILEVEKVMSECGGCDED